MSTHTLGAMNNVTPYHVPRKISLAPAATSFPKNLKLDKDEFENFGVWRERGQDSNRPPPLGIAAQQLGDSESKSRKKIRQGCDVSLGCVCVCVCVT